MIEYMEKPLSLHDQLKLIVIAHETRDLEIREAALKVLQACQNPLVYMNQTDIDLGGTN